MAPILDTSVLINIVKGDEKTRTFLETHQKEAARLTVINRYEFLRGIYSTFPPGSKRDSLIGFLNQFKIYEFTAKTAQYCAEVYQKLKTNGSLINEMDILILGICEENGESIITSDQDFVNAAKITGTRINFV